MFECLLMSTLYLKKYGYIILCVGSVQMRSFFWSVFSRIRTDRKSDTEYLSVFSSNAGKYGPGKTPYLDTFHAVNNNHTFSSNARKQGPEKTPYLGTFYAVFCYKRPKQQWFILQQFRVSEVTVLLKTGSTTFLAES